MMQFTQGDYAILQLSAQDGNGNPINLTGATFSTQILGPGAVGPVTFPNSQHAIVNATAGTFSLTLSTTDTANCAFGINKDVVTQITQGGQPIYFKGQGILTVLPNTPLA